MFKFLNPNFVNMCEVCNSQSIEKLLLLMKRPKIMLSIDYMYIFINFRTGRDSLGVPHTFWAVSFQLLLKSCKFVWQINTSMWHKVRKYEPSENRCCPHCYFSVHASNLSCTCPYLVFPHFVSKQ